jgi:hypothetical protein
LYVFLFSLFPLNGKSLLFTSAVLLADGWNDKTFVVQWQVGAMRSPSLWLTINGAASSAHSGSVLAPMLLFRIFSLLISNRTIPSRPYPAAMWMGRYPQQ